MQEVRRAQKRSKWWPLCEGVLAEVRKTAEASGAHENDRRIYMLGAEAALTILVAASARGQSEAAGE